MSPELYHAVQSSFARLEPEIEEFAVAFFHKLLRRAPRLRDHLPATQEEQAALFSDLVGYAVRNLHRRIGLEEMVGQCAARYSWSRAHVRHVSPVGAAFAYTLRERMPGGLDPTEMAGWMEAYSLISDMAVREMLDAAA